MAHIFISYSKQDIAFARYLRALLQAEGFAVWVWMDDTDRQENATFFADLLDRGVDGLLVARPSVALDVVAGRD